jgi:transcriptional regulator with XRE-family HTH domain
MARHPARIREPTFYRALGRRIRRARDGAGKSQMETAAQLGISFIQFQKYESGRNRIPIDRLLRLCAFLEVPLLPLLGADGPQIHDPLSSLIEQIDPRELRALLSSWAAIKDRRGRAVLLNLSKTVAEHIH